MDVSDLSFYKDRLRTFSLKDETANFLLGQMLVGYFVSQRSISKETERRKNGVVYGYTTCALSQEGQGVTEHRIQGQIVQSQQAGFKLRLPHVLVA